MSTIATFLEYEWGKQVVLFSPENSNLKLNFKTQEWIDNITYSITSLLWFSELEFLKKWPLEEVQEEIKRQIDIRKSEILWFLNNDEEEIKLSS